MGDRLYPTTRFRWKILGWKKVQSPPIEMTLPDYAGESALIEVLHGGQKRIAVLQQYWRCSTFGEWRDVDVIEDTT